MKYYELVKLSDDLNRIVSLETNISVSEGFKIVKNKQLIQEELKPFEEMRNTIVTKYADENGEVKPDSPNFETCLKEVTELGNQDCEDISFKKIKLSALENLELPMNVISAITFMIEDSEE